MTLASDKLELARRAFPPKMILRKPGAGERDYVSHAAVTDRLIAVDPDYETSDFDLFEGPNVEGAWWLRGTLTVGGVSRTEYGNGRDPKKAASDWIKRAAMRFGIGLDLWKKEEAEEFASLEPGSTVTDGASTAAGMGGTDVAGAEGYGEGSEAPATSSSQDAHPGEEHHLIHSPTVKGLWFCNVVRDGRKCDFVEERR